MHSLQKFLLYSSCARLVPDGYVVRVVIVCTVGPFAQPWSLWNCTCSSWFSHTFSALIVLMILLTQLMLIWWILHDNVLQCRFQRFKSLLVQSFYLLPTLNFCCVLLVRGIGWLDLSSWSMTGLSWSTWTNSSKLWKMVSWLVCMRSHL